MAQHCPIKGFKQKVFRKIETSIVKDFQSSYVNGSLKYEQLSRIVKPEDLVDYQETPNDKIYITTRFIGKGFVWGSNRGDFEIHFDTKERKVIQIYLVA